MMQPLGTAAHFCKVVVLKLRAWMFICAEYARQQLTCRLLPQTPHTEPRIPNPYPHLQTCSGVLRAGVQPDDAAHSVPRVVPPRERDHALGAQGPALQRRAPDAGLGRDVTCSVSKETDPIPPQKYFERCGSRAWSHMGPETFFSVY